MSALPPKADIDDCAFHVRFVPKADIHPSGEPRSVELIVQPGAKDAVGEMGVSEGLSSGRGATNAAGGVRIVEVAKVHVKGFYFVGPTGN